MADRGQALWYKDAIIYQLHFRMFCDSNGDGIGDFPGLTQKLDYKVLVVNNLSTSAQAVELDLKRHKGNIPIEMAGGNLFPRIGELDYLLTLAPY